MTARVFCALDTGDLQQAQKWARQLSSLPLHYKLGLEFFTAQGMTGVKKIQEQLEDKADIFLDLKLHDIPNTVAGAVRSVVKVKPRFLTIHASGGKEMMQAAVAEKGSTKILAVTVLTNLDNNDLVRIGQSGPVTEQVLRLAHLAQESGVDGVVCSPHEIETLRKALGKNFLLMVPGIRPAGIDSGDQKRTLTPAEALSRGADYLVIGRPITTADNPSTAARDILAELEAAL